MHQLKLDWNLIINLSFQKVLLQLFDGEDASAEKINTFTQKFGTDVLRMLEITKTFLIKEGTMKEQGLLELVVSGR